MSNAMSKGVVVVKAAGNSGRDGPFNADVATAAGAITLASVGSAVGDPVDKKVIMSRFSSIGPVREGGGVGGDRQRLGPGCLGGQEREERKGEDQLRLASLLHQ